MAAGKPQLQPRPASKDVNERSEDDGVFCRIHSGASSGVKPRKNQTRKTYAFLMQPLFMFFGNIPNDTTLYVERKLLIRAIYLH